MKELSLVLLGFILAAVPLWFDRKRRLKGHFRAIRAELELCKERSDTFLTDPVKSPLYRLPTRAFDVAAPILLTENALTEQESKTLARFYSQAEDINRGLDYAAGSLNDINALNREVSRLTLKAQRMIISTEQEHSLF